MNQQLAAIGVATAVASATLVGSVASAQPSVTPVADSTVASVLSAKKKPAKGTLRIVVVGEGTYTVRGKGFRKTGQATKKFKVKPGKYKVKAHGGSVKPRKVTVRKGKTKKVKVTFPKKATPTPTPTVTPAPPPAVTPSPTQTVSPSPSGSPSPTFTPPPDTTPPGPVTALTISARTSSSITLSWTNPVEADLAEVIVRQAQGSVAPSSPDSGIGVTLDNPIESFAQASGLQSGTPYAFSVFTRDANNNTGAPVSTFASTTAGPSAVTWGTAHRLSATGFSNYSAVATDISDDGDTGFALWDNPDGWLPEAGTYVSWWQNGAWGVGTKLPCNTSVGVPALSNPAAMDSAGTRALVVGVLNSCAWDGTNWTGTSAPYDPGTGFHTEYFGTAISRDATNAIVVWTVISNDYSQNDRVEAAYWNGTSWSIPVVLDPDVEHFALPKVSISDDGTKAVAVWNGLDGVRTARYVNGTWSTSQTLFDTNYSGDPQVAISADGTKAVAGVARQFSHWDSGVWSSPESLDLNGYLPSLRDLRLSADGTRANAVWSQPGAVWSAQRVNGTWQEPELVDGAQDYYDVSNLSTDQTGQFAVLAWFGDQSILSSTRTSAGWSDVAELGPGPGISHSFAPSVWLATPPDGSRTIAGWIQRDGTTSFPMAVVGERSP